MDNSNSSSGPPAGARVTLKLKAGARKAPETKPQPVARPPSKPAVNPNARWSDEYKQRMQADMDALANRR